MEAPSLTTVRGLVFPLLLLAAPAFAAPPFADVPRGHWAYGAVQRVSASCGFLQGEAGSFHGERVLDRYQMATVVAGLLDGARRSPSSAERATLDLADLALEFAREIARVRGEVATLEGVTEDLGRDVWRLRGDEGRAPGTGHGFSGFASVALLATGPDDGATFTLPQVALGVDRDLGQGVRLHAQLDVGSDVDGASPWGPAPGAASLDEAYVLADSVVGRVGAKVGKMALPMQLERVGPFRTCRRTISPSGPSSALEARRYWGLELQPLRGLQAEDVVWRLGVGTGGDALESDGRMACWLDVAREPRRDGQLGWNVGLLDDGGGDRFWSAGLSWALRRVHLLGQYLDGDHDGWFLLAGYDLDRRRSVALRYEMNAVEDGTDAITVAYNVQVTPASHLQAEWVASDDDLVEIRFSVQF